MSMLSQVLSNLQHSKIVIREVELQKMNFELYTNHWLEQTS